MNNVTTLSITDSQEITISDPGMYIAKIHNQSGSYVFNLECEDIDLNIYGLFEGHDEADYRIHTVQNHVSPRCRSNLLIKGVFRDRSRFHYTGLVKIAPGAQGSHAYQKNQNLMLSPDVFVESEPFLEIEANEVFCTHGSTTGRLNEDQLYYLKSRGLVEDRARELMVEGFLHDVRQYFQ